MITRVWHGRTSPADAAYYLDFLLTAGTAEYRRTKGIISVKVWTKEDNDCCHFYTITEWESVASIKSFAGQNYQRAVYYPEDQGILLEFEENVEHYESFDIT